MIPNVITEQTLLKFQKIIQAVIHHLTSIMAFLKQTDLLNQMTILLPGKMDDIRRHTTMYWQEQQNIKNKRESRIVNTIFSVVVVFILGLICFSIWLSIEVGINKRNIWNTAGKNSVQCL